MVWCVLFAADDDVAAVVVVVIFLYRIYFILGVVKIPCDMQVIRIV